MKATHIAALSQPMEAGAHTYTHPDRLWSQEGHTVDEIPTQLLDHFRRRGTFQGAAPQ